MWKNYYVILGVASDASGDDIKSAFRRRAMELHPDTSGLESGPFLELQEAYGVLSDPWRRRHYDREAHSIALRRRPWGPVAEPLVRERPRGEPFRPPASTRNVREVPLGEIFQRESPRSDELFDRLWNNFEAGNRPKSESLESLTVQVVLSHEEARCGGRVQVDIPARATCPACGGHGAVGFYECWRCEGRGALVTDYRVAVPYPPGLRDGYAVRMPLDRFGIENLYLTILFRVSDGW
jgi:molecular chaperone DnaJ